MLLQGMSYLESLAIVHRDLAARNVLGLFSSVSLAVLSFSVIPADSTAPDYFICPLLLSRGGSRGGSILQPLPFLQITTTRYNRYDTRCYFNVRSKADMNQLNLPHGNRQRKSGKQKKLKSKKTDLLRSISKQSGGIHVVSPEEEKESYGGKDLQKRKVFYFLFIYYATKAAQ